MGKLQMKKFMNSRDEEQQSSNKSKVNMSELQDMLSGFSNSELAKFLRDREESTMPEKIVASSEQIEEEQSSDDDRVEISEEVIGTRMECLKFSKQVLQEQAAIDFEMLNKVPNNYDVDAIIAGAEKLFQFLIKQEI